MMRLNHKRYVGRLSFVVILTTILLALPLIGILNSTVLGQEIVVTLTPVLETLYIVTIDGRNAFVRDCPSIECEILKAIPNRSSINVTGISDTWLRIRLADGRTGYVAEYLTSSTLPTLAPPTDSTIEFTPSNLATENCEIFYVEFPDSPNPDVPSTPGHCVTVVFRTRRPPETQRPTSTIQATQGLSPSPSMSPTG